MYLFRVSDPLSCSFSVVLSLLCLLTIIVPSFSLLCVPTNTEQLEDQVQTSGLNVSLNDSLVILVSPEVSLDSVLLAISETNTSSNVSTVVALNNGSYTLSSVPTTLTGNIVLVGGQTQTFPSRRRLQDTEDHQRYVRSLYPHYRPTRRRLSTAGYNHSVIEAPPNFRCFSFSDGFLQVDLIVFTGTPTAQYSGGVEILGAAAQAMFSRSDFIGNKWYHQGGALTITGGAVVDIMR